MLIFKKGGIFLNIKAAIFDMDGTLVDSLMLWEVVWSSIGEKYLNDKSFVPSYEDDKKVRTLTLNSAMDLIHKNYGFGESGEELVAIVDSIILDFYSNRVELKSGVREFLEECKSKGVKMCIASATAPELIDVALKHCDIGKYFSKVFSCAEIGKGKDEPDIFLQAAEFLGTEPKETWLFEDSLTAVETAAGIGMPVVGIYDRYNFGHDIMKKIATEYIDDGESLKKLVKRFDESADGRMEQREIWVRSSIDGTEQPSLFYGSTVEGKRPLLVALHTWSYDRFNQIKNALPLAERNGFHLLLPEFRGANLQTNPDRTKACGSEYAKQDIKDAIDFVISTEEIDEDNIFLLGSSGGGHMALLMAGYCPEYFKAMAAFVPIMDLKKWAEQNENYGKHVRACCSDSEKEMELRSPISYIDTIAKANIKIFHGKYDPVVPVTQSMELYQRVFDKYPSARVFLDIFDGGHEIDIKAAEQWLLSQYKKVEKTKVTG